MWKRSYRKIPKISPGAYIFQRPFLRGLSTEGNLRFKIDQASLIVGSKFTVFALFYFVFEGNFQVQAPRGGRGGGGLIFGGAYFQNFILCERFLQCIVTFSKCYSLSFNNVKGNVKGAVSQNLLQFSW